MPGMTVTLDQAREAKSKALALSRSGEWPATGVGIGQAFGGLAVKVNLTRRPVLELPDMINGVPVIYEVVGRVTKRKL